MVFASVGPARFHVAVARHSRTGPRILGSAARPLTPANSLANTHDDNAVAASAFTASASGGNCESVFSVVEDDRSFCTNDEQYFCSTARSSASPPISTEQFSTKQLTMRIRPRRDSDLSNISSISMLTGSTEEFPMRPRPARRDSEEFPIRRRCDSDASTAESVIRRHSSSCQDLDIGPDHPLVIAATHAEDRFISAAIHHRMVENQAKLKVLAERARVEKLRACPDNVSRKGKRLVVKRKRAAIKRETSSSSDEREMFEEKEEVLRKRIKEWRALVVLPSGTASQEDQNSPPPEVV